MSLHKLDQYNCKYEIRLKKNSYIISKICMNLRVFIKNLLYYIIIYLYCMLESIRLILHILCVFCQIKILL